MLVDGGAERGAVEHRENFESVGDLHRRRVRVTVAGDYSAAEPLRGDREFAPQLAEPSSIRVARNMAPDSGVRLARLDRGCKGKTDDASVS